MLETSQERVKLLKAGITGKTIEKLYILHNNFKIVCLPLLFEQAKITGHTSIIDDPHNAYVLCAHHIGDQGRRFYCAGHPTSDFNISCPQEKECMVCRADIHG